MSNLINSISSIKVLDGYAKKDTAIHRLHPTTKFIITIIFLIVVVSYGKYEVESLLPLIFFPIVACFFGKLPGSLIIKRILIVEPLIIGIGILNPLFDKRLIVFNGLIISSGWVAFLSIIIKCSLTVAIGIILIATTGIDGVVKALRTLKVPKIFVLQILLTYRYITLLVEESSKMKLAYSLRQGNTIGIQPDMWGRFAGQLLLKAFDRAERVYIAMKLKGFNGEYNTTKVEGMRLNDFVYLFLSGLFFIVNRFYILHYF